MTSGGEVRALEREHFRELGLNCGRHFPKDLRPGLVKINFFCLG